MAKGFTRSGLSPLVFGTVLYLGLSATGIASGQETSVQLTCVAEEGARRQPNTYAELVVPESVDLALKMHFPSMRSCERFKPSFEAYFSNPAAGSWDSGPVDNLAALGVFEMQGEFFVDQFGRLHIFEPSSDENLERPVTTPNTVGEGGVYATTRLPHDFGPVLAFAVNQRSGRTTVVFENLSDSDNTPHVYGY